MKKSYYGNLKPFAAVLMSEKDREKFLPVLEKLSEAGRELCYKNSSRSLSVLKRSSAVLAYFTEDSAKEPDIQNAVLAARNAGVPVIPILENEDTQLPELLRPFFGANNAVFQSRYDADGLSKRLLSADAMKMEAVTEKQKKGFKTTVGLLIAAAVLVLAAAAVLIFKPFTEKDSSVPAAEESVLLPEYTDTQKKAAEAAGFSIEDLEKIHSLILVGGHRLSGSGTDTVDGMLQKVEYWDMPEDPYYIWKDDTYEPAGTKLQFHENIDLSFLPLMKNLHELTLIQENITELPDISGLEKLNRLQISGCPLENIRGLDGCKSLKNITLEYTKVADLSPLNSCSSLVFLRFTEGRNEHYLENLGSSMPAGLRQLFLENAWNMKDFSSLSACTGLATVSIGADPSSDLSFLGKNTSLNNLHISTEDARKVLDLSSLENISSLQELRLDCSVKDLSFLLKQKKLEIFQLHAESNTVIPSLQGLDKLAELHLDVNRMDNLDFLDGKKNMRFLHIGTERLHDYSGFSKMENSRITELQLDVWSGIDCEALLPHLENILITNLHLNHPQNLDFSKLPQVRMLDISDSPDLENLEGIESLENIGTLRIADCMNLRSLSGLENVTRIYNLSLLNLPKLKDVEEIYNLVLSVFTWSYMPELLPDFSRMHFNRTPTIEINCIPLLENLDFLNEMPDDLFFVNLYLNALDSVTDPEPLLAKSGSHLRYPSQLKEEINKAKEMGLLDFHEIQEGDPCGSIDGINIQVESWEDLETMSPLKKSFVRKFRVHGGAILKDDEWDAEYWEGNKPVPYVDHPVNEPYPAGNGILQDLSCIDGMTGLEELSLTFQPLESLDGIQSFENLQSVNFNNCNKLTDISPLFALNNLQRINAGRLPISSIEGIQNLQHLYELSISETSVKDLSFLKSLDTSEACSEGGFCLGIDGMEKIEDYSFLSAIPKYGRLEISIYDKKQAANSNWAEYVENSEILELEARNWSFLDDDSLQAFVLSHPELQYIGLSWNGTLTDLTPLLNLQNLSRVKVSGNMKKAIASLDGKDYPFELEIEE